MNIDEAMAVEKNLDLVLAVDCCCEPAIGFGL